MTMFPAQTLLKSQQQEQVHFCYGGFDGGGGGGYGGGTENSLGVMSRLDDYNYCISEACLGSDLATNIINTTTPPPMAEDESRTNSFNEGAGSSSKENNNTSTTPTNNTIFRDEEGWLQLSIGGGGHTHEESSKQDDPTMVIRRSSSSSGGGGLIELDLLHGTSSNSNQTRPIFGEFRAPSRTTFINPQHNQEINWAFRNIPPPPHQYHHLPPPPSHHHPHHLHLLPGSSSSPSPNSQSSSSSLIMPMGASYFSRPFQVYSTGIDVAGPSSDFRVIDPPRRPHSGIWFLLQASQNQAQEPFLPQISKSYLRIKDGRMTVRLLMKYLVNKLRLDSESEVEITCRGQQLLPFLTLQHVRDNIWSPRERDAFTLLPHSSTTDHVMVLHYARSSPK